jgi:hypothetical protein
MPLTYDQISAITEKKFIPKLVDNVFDSNPIAQRARKKCLEKLDGGERIIQPLNYAMVTSSGWYSGAETLQTADNEIITAAEYTWKQLYANISINRIDELKNSGDAQKLSLVKSKTQIAEKTLEDKLATGLYSSGTDPKSIIGLRQIAAINQSVGGISQTSYSWWQAQLDSATTTLTIAAMQSRDNAASINNDSPSVIATTRALYNAYYALLQPQQRFQDSETAKGGFSSLMFNGKPVVADSYCPTGYMFFLNEKYLHLYVHKDEDMRFEPFQKPINQNVKVAKIHWAGAYGSSNNRMQAAMSALTG